MLAGETGWEPISLSFKRTWEPLQHIIEAIRQKKLTVATSRTRKGSHALRLNRDEVNAWFMAHHDPQKDFPGVMSAAVVGRSVGIRDKTGVQALMADGYSMQKSAHQANGMARRCPADRGVPQKVCHGDWDRAGKHTQPI